MPKMEVLDLIRPFWGWVFPYISRTYSLAYIGEYLHFRYLNCLVIYCCPPHFPAHLEGCQLRLGLWVVVCQPSCVIAGGWCVGMPGQKRGFVLGPCGG